MRIRVVGPSSPFREDAFARGVALLRARGHDVIADDALQGSHAYLNGDDAVRTAHLSDALAADVDVVWLARGGYGLTRVVDGITLPERPPVVIGFSDATALFARFAHAGLLDFCVHGPLMTTIASEPEASIDRAFAMLADGDLQQMALPPLTPLVGPTGVTVRGPLWAGNMVVLAAMVGTASMPSLAGHIVVVEEVGERPYRIDRVLTQLTNSGAFDGVRAFVVGHLTDCDEPPSPHSTRDKAPRGIDVVAERLGRLNVPVVMGLPCGHEAPNLALRLGHRYELVVGNDTAALFARQRKEHQHLLA